MATIALHAGKMNQMPTLMKGAKNAVSSLKTQLDTLKRKCEKVNPGVCNIDDVISSITTSTRTQEDKIEALDTFSEQVEQFIQDTAQIDDDVAELIDQNKDDFYDKYSYLKPDCEKSKWEKFKDGLKKVGEWCKEHWAALVTVVVAVLAVVAIVVASVLTFGAAAVALVAAIGAVIGLLGQLIGDTIKFFVKGFSKGEWKWPGTWEDYLGAVVGGAVGGIMTLVGGPVLGCTVDAIISSLLSNSLKDLTGGEAQSLGDLWLEAAVEGVSAMLIGTILGKAFDGLTNKFSKFLANKIPALRRLAGRGSYAASYKMVQTKLINGTIKKYTSKTILNGLRSEFVSNFLKMWQMDLV